MKTRCGWRIVKHTRKKKNYMKNLKNENATQTLDKFIFFNGTPYLLLLLIFLSFR